MQTWTTKSASLNLDFGNDTTLRADNGYLTIKFTDAFAGKFCVIDIPAEKVDYFIEKIREVVDASK